MLVHRIMVIHVELHHRHNAAERVDEGAENAGLVHAPQDGLGIVCRGQDFQEQPVRFLVLAHSFGDELERARGDAHGFGMEGQIVLLRQMKQPDQIDRIASEYIGARNIDAVVVDDEIVGAGELLGLRRRTQSGDHAA